MGKAVMIAELAHLEGLPPAGPGVGVRALAVRCAALGVVACGAGRDFLTDFRLPTKAGREVSGPLER